MSALHISLNCSRITSYKSLQVTSFSMCGDKYVWNMCMCVYHSPVPCHLPVFPHEPSLVCLWWRNMWGCCSTTRLSSPRTVAVQTGFLARTSRTEPASGEAEEEYPQTTEKETQIFCVRLSNCLELKEGDISEVRSCFSRNATETKNNGWFYHCY